jgi:hypothetical protein
MLRKLLGSWLVVSWVILSGFDLVEDLEFPKPIQVHALPDASLPKADRGPNTLNNIVESADHRQPSYAWFFNLSAVNSSVDGVIPFKKVSRLHKLNRVFLI